MLAIQVFHECTWHYTFDPKEPLPHGNPLIHAGSWGGVAPRRAVNCQTRARNVLDNNLFRERMLELDFSLPENITAAFLNPQMDVDLAVSFSLMLRGTEYEPLDVAFILREDAVARGADHWAVKNFFSVSAQRIYELIHLMRQEEREIADLIF